MTRLVPTKDSDSPSVPRVRLTPLAEARMSLLIEECPYEIGWLSLVRFITPSDGRTVIVIEDAILFDQGVSSGTTEIDPQSILKVGYAMYEEDGDTSRMERLQAWGHSHVNMATFASGQDDHQVRVLADNGLPHIVRLIGNKRGDLRIDLYTVPDGAVIPSREMKTTPHLGWKILGSPIEGRAYERLRRQVQAEIKNKVRLLGKRDSPIITPAPVSSWTRFSDNLHEKAEKTAKKAQRTASKAQRKAEKAFRRMKPTGWMH